MPGRNGGKPSGGTPNTWPEEERNKNRASGDQSPRQWEQPLNTPTANAPDTGTASDRRTELARQVVLADHLNFVTRSVEDGETAFQALRAYREHTGEYDPMAPYAELSDRDLLETADTASRILDERQG